MYALFAQQAALRPRETALAAPARPPLSFGDLMTLVDGVAGILSAMGVERHDRVAVALPTSAERLVVQAAVSCWCAAAPINPALRPGEIEALLSRLGIRLVIVPSGENSAALAAAHNLGIASLELTPLPGAPAGMARLGAADVLGAGAQAGRRGAGAGPEDIALLLPTSGTTGSPKIVPLSQANVCAGAANIVRAMNLGPGDRLLSLAQLHHIAGISLTLAALSAGGSVYCTPGFHAPDFFPWMEEADPTWLWVAPAMLHEIVGRAAAYQEVLARSRLRLIRVGSAPLAERLRAEAEELLHVPVLENYGMTEAAPQIASTPLPPGKRKRGSVGLPVGVEVEIEGEGGTFLPRGSAGEIVIRGPSVMGCYLGGEDAADGSFVRGWFRTGDQGYLDEEGYLFLTGRIKEIINRGGEKISPLEVDGVLLRHPEVEKAVTFPIPHPSLGEEIAAAVVLRPGRAVTEQELQEFVVRELSVSKVPRRVVILEEIPSDERGKVRRLRMAEQLGLTRPASVSGDRPSGDDAAPRTPVERDLAAMWKDVLRLKEGEVLTNARFLDLGGDSISAVLIISRVRGSFNVDLSPVTFFEAPTIAGLARIIEEKLGSGPVAGPQPEG